MISCEQVFPISPGGMMVALAYPPTDGSIAVRPTLTPLPGRRVGGQTMPARPPETLYWRRRAIALVLLAAAVAALAVAVSIVLAGLGGGPLTTTGSSGGPAMPAAKIHLVEPGDTLWSIVRASGVRGDPRPVVDQLQQELGDRPLQIGQWVPVP
jgi:hypothetical protein